MTNQQEKEKAIAFVKKRLNIELKQHHKEDYFKDKYYYCHIEIARLRRSLTTKEASLSKLKAKYKSLYKKNYHLKKNSLIFHQDLLTTSCLRAIL